MTLESVQLFAMLFLHGCRSHLGTADVVVYLFGLGLALVRERPPDPAPAERDNHGA